MAKPPHEILQDLENMQAEIPQIIKTGVPKNVKSDKIRSLELRSNQAVQDILALLVADQEGESFLIKGFTDPNVEPPEVDYGPGQLYQIVNPTTYEVLSFWIYTGVNGIGWWEFKKDVPPKKVFSVKADPNEAIISGAEIGDFYVQTSTGDADGDVESVWMFLELASGSQWIRLSDYTEGVVAFTDLDDVPNSYTGKKGQVLVVSEDETKLKFVKLTDLLIGKSITANVSGAYNIDLAAMVEHYNLTFIENSSIGFTNMIGTNQSVVKTLTLTGQKSWLLPSYLVALPNNDDYDGSVLNQVVINITRGGANPAGYYSLINMT